MAPSAKGRSRPDLLVSPGTQAIAFVSNIKWVQANYRETQLTNVNSPRLRVSLKSSSTTCSTSTSSVQSSPKPSPTTTLLWPLFLPLQKIARANSFSHGNGTWTTSRAARRRQERAEDTHHANVFFCHVSFERRHGESLGIGWDQTPRSCGQHSELGNSQGCSSVKQRDWRSSRFQSAAHPESPHCKALHTDLRSPRRQSANRTKAAGTWLRSAAPLHTK